MSQRLLGQYEPIRFAFTPPLSGPSIALSIREKEGRPAGWFMPSRKTPQR